jgi:hypothetical protein
MNSSRWDYEAEKQKCHFIGSNVNYTFKIIEESCKSTDLPPKSNDYLFLFILVILSTSMGSLRFILPSITVMKDLGSSTRNRKRWMN